MVLDPDPGHDVEVVDVNALGFSTVVHDMKEADFQVALSRALLAPVILSEIQVAAECVASVCNSSHLFHDGTDNVGVIPPLSSASSSSLPASFDLALYALVEGGWASGGSGSAASW